MITLTTAQLETWIGQLFWPFLRIGACLMVAPIFGARFGTETQCRAALFALRWGKGWVCPACGHGRCAELTSRAVYQCNRCKHQVGLTAGTVFHWTKLPLTTWFLAIYHLTQSKGGMSSVELADRRRGGFPLLRPPRPGREPKPTKDETTSRRRY